MYVIHDFIITNSWLPIAQTLANSNLPLTHTII